MIASNEAITEIYKKDLLNQVKNDNNNKLEKVHHQPNTQSGFRGFRFSNLNWTRLPKQYKVFTTSTIFSNVRLLKEQEKLQLFPIWKRRKKKKKILNMEKD